MSSLSVCLALTLTLFGVTWGHLCLLSPPQRGSMQGINKAGADDCILLKSPCGGREPHRDGPSVGLMAGERFVIAMQKNLDHFNKTAPGYFSVSLMEEHGPNPGQDKEVLKFNDTSDPALTIFAANITVPETPGRMILQARYVTNNPQAPPAFYQCADVHIMPRPHSKKYVVLQ